MRNFVAEIIEARVKEGPVTVDMGATNLRLELNERGFTTTWQAYGRAAAQAQPSVTYPTVRAWCVEYDYLARIAADMLQRAQVEAKTTAAKVAAIYSALAETVLFVPLGDGRAVKLEAHTDELDESWILYGPGRKKYTIPGRPWSGVREWCEAYPELVDVAYQAALEYEASKAF